MASIEDESFKIVLASYCFVFYFFGLLSATVKLVSKRENIKKFKERYIPNDFRYKRWSIPNCVIPVVYIILCVIPFISSVDSEYAAVALLALAIRLPLTLELKTRRLEGTLLVAKQLLLKRKLETSQTGYYFYTLKFFGMMLGYFVLLCIVIEPGIISLVRIEPEQGDVLRKVANIRFKYSFMKAAHYKSVWVYIPLIMMAVFHLNPSAEASFGLRMLFLASKIATIVAVQLSKFVGYRACNTASADITECFVLIYNTAPTEQYLGYVLLILLSHTLLMDDSFRTRKYKVEENG